ncbi:protein phosphatase regulatory subunit Sds22 [Schizosaccharomyces japonicus yFS275]|uniref:Protein phosphatase regulatory subunit Sds22 n=1 Tax=Schizosaccharomyces japonicus (strain yFS275 / FY16936) TaxID=402676 RepID=B6K888_SCHJY|nr:protein phosphatase regulatory subunit Sds22 [Schizosaccharomyces japonicus yFS275]EEB09742.2 protein phosphatase regulatory subunit Sds22 [Schizosaccharomyces japonicus yFS275]
MSDTSTDNEENAKQLQQQTQKTIIDDPNVEQIEADEDLLSELPNDIDAIDLINARVSSMGNLGLQRFTNLENLCLRQNRIHKIECVPTSLKELDLYDNLITKIEGLEQSTDLINLDLSFNNIKKIKNVDHLKNLENLYFVQNRIRKIENLEGLSKLTNLELGGNKIRVIENLDTLKNLKELWLGKNKITVLQNLENLTNLRLLSIQSNRILRFENLSGLANCLEELYISYNGLTSLEGIEVLTNLRTLDVSNNRIEHLTHLKGLKHLEELWASNNQISSFAEVEEQLGDKEELNTVYFEGNPLQTSNRAAYVNKVRLCLPQIRQLDATFLSAQTTFAKP